MDFKELKQVIELFSKSNIDNLELEREGLNLRLGKKRPKTVTVAGAEGAPVAAAVMPQPPAESPAEAEEEDAGLIYVTSPIVGTFYRSPSPNSPPFVEPGDRVHQGQTLCIVEAMKLMNEIQADQAGEVVKILVENGEGVEFGQNLFALKPL